MSTESQPSALIKFGPILGPAAGVVIMIGLIAWVLLSGDVSEERNKLSTKNGEVTSLLSKTDVSRPVVSSNPINLGPDLEREWERDAWEMSGNERTAVDLPMLYGVTTDGADVKVFAQFDEDENGVWDESEFENSPFKDEEGDKGDFTKWDRNNDGEISKTEFETPPVDPKKLYEEKNSDNSDDGLDESEFPQLTEADRDQNGRANLEEFVWWMGGGRVSFTKIALVSDVTALVDANKMKVVISWTEPEIEDGFRPKDLEYRVYASSPEDRVMRDREHGIKSAKYTADLAVWRAAFKEWKSAKHETKSPKTNLDVYGRIEAEKEYIKAGNAKPAKPDPVSEWNEVTKVTGTQCEISFLLGSTYRYAVSVVTSSDLLKSNREIFIKNKKAPFETSMVEQTTAPVRMENRVAIEHNGKSGETGRVSLSTWIANASGDYYWVTITDDVSEDDPDLGGEYSLSALIKMKASAGDDELAAVMEGVDATEKFNFVPYANIPRGSDSGQAITFVTVSGSNFLLTSRAHGDYLLSKDAKGKIRHSVGEGDTQVRCLNISRRNAVFEVTRWVEADGKWFLAVLTQKVTEGKDVGSKLDLSSSNKVLKVYDEKGKLVTGPKVEVDFSVGEYGGIDGRNVKLDDTDFDIFGVLLK